MNNLNELKELWQKQPVAKLESLNFKEKLPGLVKKLQSYEKKQLRINLFKTVTMAALIFLIGFMLKYMNVSAVGAAGVAILAVSVTWFMTVYWKKQFRVSELNLSDNSFAFMDFAISRLEEQKKLFKVHFQYFALGMAAGVNLLYLDVYSSYDTGIRLAMHIGVTLFLLMAMFLGKKFRMRRIKNELQPLIDELTQMKKDLNEQEDKNEML